MNRMHLPTIKDSEPCSCFVCALMCCRPCWPIPSDIRALIKAGEGDRLMLDWWEGSFGNGGSYENTYIVCPANPGHEGTMAPRSISELDQGCVFRRGGLCDLHERGLKPAEGKAAHHTMRRPEQLHEDVARHWDTDDGREVVAAWCLLVGAPNPYE